VVKPRQGRGIVRLSGAAGPAGSLFADLLAHRRDPERAFQGRELDRESGGSAGREFGLAYRLKAARTGSRHRTPCRVPNRALSEDLPVRKHRAKQRGIKREHDHGFSSPNEVT